MKNLNLLLTSANGNLKNKEKMIRDAVEEARDCAFEKLDVLQDIDVVITNYAPYLLIKEDGVGGYTHSGSFIFMAIDDNKISKAILREMLCHEICHAARMQYNGEKCDTLIKAIINEGLATYFESTISKHCKDRQFFIKTVEARSDRENLVLLKKMAPYFDYSAYSDSRFFYRGDDAFPRWAGYSVGMVIVRKYLEQHPQSFCEVNRLEYSLLANFAKKMAQV